MGTIASPHIKMWIIASKISKHRGLDVVKEHRFHSKRRWRFDIAFPDQKLAIEIEGGAFSMGRHVRGKGYEADCEKYNTAVCMGWKVLRYTTGMIKKMDVESILSQIEECLITEGAYRRGGCAL